MNDDWIETTLGDVGVFVNGYPFKPDQLTGSTLPVIRIRQLLDREAEVDYTDEVVPDRSHITDGDLIFSWSGTLASIIWDRGPALLNQHLFKVTERPGAIRGWLHLALDHAVESLLEKSHGTTMKHITKGVLEAHKVSLPPLPVQRRIVDLMAHLDNQIANLRTERDAACTLLVSARDELLQTGSDWTSTRLSGVTTKIGSGATPRGGESAYRAEGVSLIRSQNVYDLRFEWDGLAHIGPEQARLLDNVTVEQGDVLLNITGASVNRCCIVPDVALPARVNQHVAIIRSNRSFVVPDFLVHLLRRSDTLALLNRMAGAGTTRQALTKNQIEQLAITIPKVSEQQRLAGILTSLSRQVSALQTEIDALSEARGAALSSVLSGQAALSSDYDSLLDGAA